MPPAATILSIEKATLLSDSPSSCRPARSPFSAARDASHEPRRRNVPVVTRKRVAAACLATGDMLLRPSANALSPVSADAVMGLRTFVNGSPMSTEMV